MRFARMVQSSSQQASADRTDVFGAKTIQPRSVQEAIRRLQRQRYPSFFGSIPIGSDPGVAPL